MALFPITETQAILKRDFRVDPAVRVRLDPTNALAVEAGEFAAILSTNADVVTLGAITGNVHTAVGSSSYPSNEALLFQIFTERGRSDVQAIDKLTVLWSFPYEAETNVFDPTGGISIGQPLTVAAGSGLTASRLVLQPAAANEVIYAWSLSALATSVAPLGRTRLRYRFVGPTFIQA